MANFKLSFPPLTGGELRTGILVSLTIHLGIIMICISLPSAKSVPQRQIIHITFPAESEFLENRPHPAAMERKKGAETILIKNVKAKEKRIEEENNRSKVVLPERNEIIIARQTLSNDPVKKDIAEDIVPEKNTDVNNTGPINISHLSEAGTAAAIIGAHHDQKGIIESRFGEKGSPSFVYQAMPVYPILARRMGREGKVLLKLLIDMNGKLQQIEVVERADYGFTEAAIEAVKKSTYAPGYRNGERVAMKALLPIRFQLQ